MALALMLALCAVNVAALADGETVVYVTIANGNLELTQKAVTVTDTDNDGKLTINDALYCAHEENYYPGGAAAGYATEEGQYGLSLAKLWGVANGGSYGYYVNNASAWSLLDEVKNGDYLDAFVYTDTTAWSDTYCYFEERGPEMYAELNEDIETSKEITLTLLAAAFDEEFKPITKPVAGATITIDGKETAFVTDENGKVTVTVEGNGDHVISAVGKDMLLVPPACLYTISLYVVCPPGPEVESESDATPTEIGEATVTSSDAKTVGANPKTGDASPVALVAGLMAVAFVGMAIARRKSHEA